MGSKTKSQDDDILDDADDWDSDNDDKLEAKAPSPVVQQRSWRDLERFKEEREMKKLLDGSDWDDL